MINPLDLPQLELTPEGEKDKILWELSIQSLKGTARRIAFEEFISRHHVLPRSHPLRNPI